MWGTSTKAITSAQPSLHRLIPGTQGTRVTIRVLVVKEVVDQVVSREVTGVLKVAMITGVTGILGTRVVQKVRVTRVTRVRTKGTRIRVDRKVRVAKAPRDSRMTGSDWLDTGSCWPSQGDRLVKHLLPCRSLLVDRLLQLLFALLKIHLKFPVFLYLYSVLLMLTLLICKW